jgi:hypothetical protein
MAKRRVLVLLMALVALVNVFSSEWDLEGSFFEFAYNWSESKFLTLGSDNNALQITLEHQGYKYVGKQTKLPKEITQYINYKFNSYDLDVGDLFFCVIYKGRSALNIAIRITTVTKGKWTWDYYAYTGVHY